MQKHQSVKLPLELRSMIFDIALRAARRSTLAKVKWKLQELLVSRERRTILEIETRTVTVIRQTEKMAYVHVVADSENKVALKICRPSHTDGLVHTMVWSKCRDSSRNTERWEVAYHVRKGKNRTYSWTLDGGDNISRLNGKLVRED